jgi:hypothetical protein
MIRPSTIGWSVALLVLGVTGCSPSRMPVDDAAGTQTSGTGGASSSADATMASDSATTTAAEPDGCWREIEGDLRVDSASDWSEIAQVRSVSGAVVLDLSEVELTDLSVLGCLERAAILDFYACGDLPTTNGLVHLNELGALHVGFGCRDLGALEGLGQVRELDWVQLVGLPRSHISLPNVERIGTAMFGPCADKPFETGPASLGEFDSLIEVEKLYVYSMGTLTDVSILDALIANGAPPLRVAQFQRNVQVPESEILEKLQLLGAESSVVCGNKDGAPCEQCPPPA